MIQENGLVKNFQNISIEDLKNRRSTEKLSRIGFGHSMRCTRINVSFSKKKIN